MTRVAYVLERYPELSQTFVEDELRELRRTGVDLDVLALAPGESARLADAHFAPVYPPRGARRLGAAGRLALVRPAELARSGDWPPGGDCGASAVAWTVSHPWVRSDHACTANVPSRPCSSVSDPWMDTALAAA